MHRQPLKQRPLRRSLLIKHFAQVLDANVAFGIAAYGFVEGSKTAPDPVEISSCAS
jgi:hypothetical protein